MAKLEDTSEWQALQRLLEQVARDANAFNAYVLDAWDMVWCSSRGSAGTRADLGDFIRLAAARKGVPLIRGGKFDTCLSGRMGEAYLKSFGSCYALLLRFSGAFDGVKVRAIVASAIDQIETLTLKLPPPDGPGSDGNEAVGVA